MLDTAQEVAMAYSQELISKNEARKLLGFGTVEETGPLARVVQICPTPGCLVHVETLLSEGDAIPAARRCVVCRQGADESGAVSP